MQAEVLAVGSELLPGQIVDTNSAVIARHLAAIGLNLFHKTTVGDNLPRIAAALPGAEERARVLARAAVGWAGARGGAATCLEDVLSAAPPVMVAAIAVSVDGVTDAREYRFGGDLPSMPIRAATLTLDLIRRSLPLPRWGLCPCERPGRRLPYTCSMTMAALHPEH